MATTIPGPLTAASRNEPPGLQSLSDPATPVTERYRQAIPGFDSERELLAAINLDEVSCEELRDADPEFARLAQIYERILDKRVVDKVRSQAIAGDSKAQALYTSKMRCPEVAFERFHQSASLGPRPARTSSNTRSDSKKADRKSDVRVPTITAEIAEAMIAAGLFAAGDCAEDCSPPPMPAVMPKITREHYRMLEIEPPSTPVATPDSAPNEANPQPPPSRRPYRTTQDYPGDTHPYRKPIHKPIRLDPRQPPPGFKGPFQRGGNNSSSPPA